MYNIPFVLWVSLIQVIPNTLTSLETNSICLMSKQTLFKTEDLPLLLKQVISVDGSTFVNMKYFPSSFTATNLSLLKVIVFNFPLIVTVLLSSEIKKECFPLGIKQLTLSNLSPISSSPPSFIAVALHVLTRFDLTRLKKAVDCFRSCFDNLSSRIKMAYVQFLLVMRRKQW